MKKIKKFRIITASISALLLLSLTALLIVHQSNNSLRNRLDSERLKTEALLSEKLLVQKSLDKAKGSNGKLEKQLSNLSEELKVRASVISTQTEENKQIKRALRLADDHNKSKNEINAHLNEKLGSAELEVARLDSVKSIAFDSLKTLRDEVAYLQNELNDATLRSIDKTMITGVKKRNDHISYKAKSVRKLIANVSVPGVLSDLTFIVEGPDGSVIPDQRGLLTANVIEDDKTLIASTRENMFSELKPQQLQITYLPKERLKPGTYTFKIFNKAKYVGSMKVKLR